MTPNERRVTPRYRPKAGCHVVYVEGTGGIKDLSLTGVFVLDEEPLQVGTEVKFSIRQGVDEISKISLQGVVARSEPGRGMAIRFKDISREAIRKLKLYIAGLGPESDKAPDREKYAGITRKG